MSHLLTRTDVLDLIAGGENSGVEFKRDDINPRDLAKELVAFVNFEGGRILLGVEDDGSISGLTRSPDEVEEWVMNVCRVLIRPGLIPYFQILKDVEPAKDIAVVQVDRGWTVHHRFYNNRPFYYIRVGTESREMNQEELGRLFQQRGAFRVELRPVPKSGLNDFDLGRLSDYFGRIRQQETPPLNDDSAWLRLLVNTEIMVEEEGVLGSVAGVVLFGKNPNRFFPQAGITVVAYPDTKKERVEPESIRGPLVSLFRTTPRGVEIVEPGVIDRAMYWLRERVTEAALVNGTVRIQRWHYPEEALREAVVNAVAHRDYLLYASDIEIALYADRLEIISPGRLPNGITPERMRTGCRAARNQLIKDTLRDYGYMEHIGLGIPRKIIRLMREHNGTEPDLEVSGEQFTVRLWRN